MSTLAAADAPPPAAQTEQAETQEEKEEAPLPASAETKAAEETETSADDSATANAPDKTDAPEKDDATTSSNDEKEMVERADAMIQEEILFDAARLLQTIKDETLLTDQHRHVMTWAKEMEDASADLLVEADSTWTKQYETKKGNTKERDTTLHYKVDTAARLDCRIDCVLESSLLVPLLSVFNETSLYQTWMPSWKVPVTLGVQESIKLKQVSKGHQIIQISAKVPWPFSTRDIVMRAAACDDIAAHNAIVVRMKGVNVGEDESVPEPKPSVVRADFEGAILFRPCPEDKWKRTSPDEESRLLVSLKMFVDPKLTAVPTSLINFVTRTVILTMWKMLLKVAEGVRDGERPLHAEAIEEKPELYKWIQSRIDVLLGQMDEVKTEDAGNEADAEASKS